jgi:hypothetical protein
MFSGAEISGTCGISLSRFLLRLEEGHLLSPEVEREYVELARLCEVPLPAVVLLPPSPNHPFSGLFSGLVLW